MAYASLKCQENVFNKHFSMLRNYFIIFFYCTAVRIWACKTRGMCGASISLEHILQTGNFSVSAWALGGQETGELAEQVGYGRLPEKKGNIFHRGIFIHGICHFEQGCLLETSAGVYLRRWYQPPGVKHVSTCTVFFSDVLAAHPAAEVSLALGVLPLSACLALCLNTWSSAKIAFLVAWYILGCSDPPKKK